jgi:peptide/nickel transport system permease protein
MSADAPATDVSVARRATDVSVARRASLGRRPSLVSCSAAILTIAVLAALLAPVISPYDPASVDLGAAYSGPSGAHLLGADASGRDILSRLIHGARPSLGGPALVVLSSTVVGTLLGMIAGYWGGAVDGILGRSFDVLLAFPPLLLAIVIVATLGQGFLPAIAAISIVYVPLIGRVVRGVVLVERRKTYVQVARMQGFGTPRIVFRHLLPNVGSVVVAQSTLNFGYALIDLAALSFIGLGVKPPTADWGGMLADAKSSILTTSNPVIWPSIAIVLVVIAVNVVGDALAIKVQTRGGADRG